MSEEKNVDARFQFLSEEVIPRMVNKLNFENPDLMVSVNEKAFFTNPKSPNQHFVDAYNEVTGELLTESKSKIDILMAKKKAMYDSQNFVEITSDDGNNSDIIDYLKIENAKLLNDLEAETEKYKTIQGVQQLLSLVFRQIYRI